MARDLFGSGSRLSDWLNSTWPSRFWLAFPAICLILFSRSPGILIEPQLWAEDGRVFLAQALQEPGWANLIKPHAGYLQLLPRLVAGFFSIYTLLNAPLVFNAVALAAAAFSIWLLLSDVSEELLPRPWRLLAAAAVCLLPWWTETLGNLTNAHWYLFFAAALITLADLDRLNRFARITLPLFMALTAFSAPTTVLLIPVLIINLIRGFRARGYGFFLQAWTLGLVAVNVGLALILAHETAGPELTWPGAGSLLTFLAKAVGYKVIALSLFGQGFAARHLASRGAYLGMSGFFAVLVLVEVWALVRRSDAGRVGLTLIYYILSPLAFYALIRPSATAHFVGRDAYSGGDRYFVVPCFFFILLVIHLARLLRPGPKPRALAAGLCLLGLIFAQAAWQNYNYPARRDFRWRAHVKLYYQKLLDVGRGPGRRYVIKIPPGGQAWYVPLPLFRPGPRQRDRLEKLL